MASNAVHSEFNIAKERDYERVQQKLYEEFKQLDVNNDGSITLDEIIEFLQKKVRVFKFDLTFKLNSQEMETQM